MKTISLFVTMFAISSNNSFGAENNSAFAREICEKEFNKMVQTGLLTPNQRDEWRIEEHKVVSGLNEAMLSEDTEAINTCSLLLHNYIEKFTQLSTQANKLLETNLMKVD